MSDRNSRKRYNVISKGELLWLCIFGILSFLFWAIPLPAYGQIEPILFGWLPWPVLHIFLFTFIVILAWFVFFSTQYKSKD